MCETQLLPKSILLRSSPALPVPWSQSPLAPNFLPQLLWVLGLSCRVLVLGSEGVCTALLYSTFLKAAPNSQSSADSCP